jgi:hypothetical protein
MWEAVRITRKNIATVAAVEAPAILAGLVLLACLCSPSHSVSRLVLEIFALVGFAVGCSRRMTFYIGRRIVVLPVGCACHGNPLPCSDETARTWPAIWRAVTDRVIISLDNVLLHGRYDNS